MRDPSTGTITGIGCDHLDKYNIKGLHCVIIDDIMDAGGTFKPIIAQLEGRGAKVSLYVTHCLASKGLDGFGNCMIYTTKSIPLSTRTDDVKRAKNLIYIGE